MKDSWSGDEEEFKDSREDLPSRDQIGLSSNQEQAPSLQQTSVGPSSNPGNQPKVWSG